MLNETVVVAGDLSLKNHSGFEQKSDISKYIIHPEYDSDNSFANDICLLYMDTPFNLTGKNVKNIELATVDPKPGTPCDISGWGLLNVSPIYFWILGNSKILILKFEYALKEANPDSLSTMHSTKRLASFRVYAC